MATSIVMCTVLQQMRHILSWAHAHGSTIGNNQGPIELSGNHT